MSNTNDLNTKMNEMYKSMSKGQKLLTNYITDNYDKAAFLTAAKLGKTVGVSESTVVRFAMFLGYKGYPEFQKALEETVRNKLNSVQRMEVTYGRIEKNAVLSSVWTTLMRQYLIRLWIPLFLPEEYTWWEFAVVRHWLLFCLSI